MKLAKTDVVFTVDGHVLANTSALPLAQRVGRRTLRFAELTPAEEAEVRAGLSEAAAEALATLGVKRGGAR